jgi:hypothetical protein
MVEGVAPGARKWRIGYRRRACPQLILDLQACEGSTCLTQAMTSIGTDPETGQGSSTGEAGARRARP